MKLFEHPDFEQAVLEAVEHFGERGLRPAIIEKDYYVIEVLRIIAGTVGKTCDDFAATGATGRREVCA